MRHCSALSGFIVGLVAVPLACGGTKDPGGGGIASPPSSSDASAASPPAEPAPGEGTIAMVDETSVAVLVLEPYGAASEGGAPTTVKPNARGHVKAGIYKVPGGTYIAVPDGGTVHVRPDEGRGVMIGGLPFQLDTEVKLVTEDDPEGLSFVRSDNLTPNGMPTYGPRYLRPGAKVAGAAILAHRDHIHQTVLHADVAADSRQAFRSTLGLSFSDHFYIDFDGTLYQALDVAWCAYHAGEANNRSVSVTLNNPLKNLEREPRATPYPRLIPEGAGLSPPVGAPAPTGPCKLDSGHVSCEVKGMAFGFEGDQVIVLGGGDLFSTNDGSNWSQSSAPPFEPIGLRYTFEIIVAYGEAGKVAVTDDLGRTWALVDAGSKRAWRDAWVGSFGDEAETVVVLVGDGGSIARSTDSGKTFARVASGAKGDFKAIASVGEGRLIASLGERAFESRDGGASWKPVTEKLDLATLVPPPGLGRCVDRPPGPGEVCPYATTFQTLHFVEAFVQVGELGLAYLSGGYSVTEDRGLSWEPAVSPARAEELARYTRPVSERMTINHARVRAYGYTEEQYQALGSLARLLANVFPALSRVAGLDADGQVIDRVLDDPAAAKGVLAHWHLEAMRWDPGPGFDWARLAKELAGRPL